MRAMASPFCHNGQWQTEPFAWFIARTTASRWKSCDPRYPLGQRRPLSPRRKRLAGSSRIAGCATRPIRSGHHLAVPRGVHDGSSPSFKWDKTREYWFIFHQVL